MKEPPLKRPNPAFARRVTKKPGFLAACNANYAQRSRPRRYKQAVLMLANPAYSLKDIERRTGFHYHTLRAITEKEQTSIEQQKYILKRQYARTLRRLADRVEDQAPHMKARDAIFGVSVFSERLALLSGDATSHNLNVNVNAVDIAGNFQKLHDRITAAQPKPKGTLPTPQSHPPTNGDSLGSALPRQKAIKATVVASHVDQTYRRPKSDERLPDSNPTPKP